MRSLLYFERGKDSLHLATGYIKSQHLSRQIRTVFVEEVDRLGSFNEILGIVNDKRHEMCWSKEIAIKNGVSFWIGCKKIGCIVGLVKRMYKSGNCRN